MKLGEFELNKIYCMDCLEGLKKIPDNSVDLVVTSPPYNKGSADRKIGKTDSWKKANIGYGDFKDNLPERKYQEWQKNVLKECIRVLKPSGSIFYNHKPRIINHTIISPFEWLSKFLIKQRIVWLRNGSPTLEPIRFMPNTEDIFWIIKERKTPKFTGSAFNYGEVWKINVKSEKEHPAPFPIELPRRCIKSCTNERDIVLDPFIGSGTTALASQQLNRNFIGFEINPEYCKIANKRLEQENINQFIR